MSFIISAAFIQHLSHLGGYRMYAQKNLNNIQKCMWKLLSLFAVKVQGQGDQVVLSFRIIFGCLSAALVPITASNGIIVIKKRPKPVHI